MQAVILAGGRGTRLAPYTTVLPKPLMPIGQYPILEVILRQLRGAGFERAEIATGYLSQLIESYFGDGSRLDIPVSYHKEESPAGTAGPLVLMEDALEDNFLVMNGDVLTDLDFCRLFTEHCSSGAALTAATCERTVTLGLGAIIRNSDGGVVDYLEKPTYHFECSAGIYVMHRRALQYIARKRPFDLPDLFKALISAGEDVETYPIEGFWLDIGTPEDYQQANERFANRFETLGDYPPQ